MSRKVPKPILEALVDRIRLLTGRKRGLAEIRMFGGLCFTVNGNMALGVTGDGELMVRVAKESYETLLEEPFARPMEFTGRPMRGFVHVEAEALEDDEGLRRWLDRGFGFAASLPPKAAKKKAAKKKAKRKTSR